MSTEMLPRSTDLTEVERAYNERRELAVAEFGDGLPWQMEHYENEIRNEMRRGCEAFLRAGRLLTVARECTTHGEWEGMLNRLGLDRSQSARMIEAARRMANVATSQHLLAATKSQSKLIELLSLPEGQFQELADTGETGGLTTDDVAKMGVRELRAAIRELREQISVKDERASARERAVETLQHELRKARRQWQEATPDEQLARLKLEVTKAIATIEVTIAEHNPQHGLHGALMAVHDHLVEHGGNEAHWVIAQLDNLKRQIDCLKLAWTAAV